MASRDTCVIFVCPEETEGNTEDPSTQALFALCQAVSSNYCWTMPSIAALLCLFQTVPSGPERTFVTRLCAFRVIRTCAQNAKNLLLREHAQRTWWTLLLQKRLPGRLVYRCNLVVAGLRRGGSGTVYRTDSNREWRIGQARFPISCTIAPHTPLISPNYICFYVLCSWRRCSTALLRYLQMCRLYWIGLSLVSRSSRDLRFCPHTHPSFLPTLFFCGV